jgi:hypothetical protein
VSLRPLCLTGLRLEAGGLATLKVGFSFLLNCVRAYLSVFHFRVHVLFNYVQTCLLTYVLYTSVSRARDENCSVYQRVEHGPDINAGLLYFSFSCSGVAFKR